MESETFLSLSRSAECRNAIYRVNGRVTAQPTESGGDCFSRFLCLPLVCAVSVLHILCLWWLKLSSQWKSTHCVQGFVTSCFCLVFDSLTARQDQWHKFVEMGLCGDEAGGDVMNIKSLENTKKTSSHWESYIVENTNITTFQDKRIIEGSTTQCPERERSSRSRSEGHAHTAHVIISGRKKVETGPFGVEADNVEQSLISAQGCRERQGETAPSFKRASASAAMAFESWTTVDGCENDTDLTTGWSGRGKQQIFGIHSARAPCRTHPARAE